MASGLYGAYPPQRLWSGTDPTTPIQFSPLMPPDALDILGYPHSSLDQFVLNAPAGTIERRHTLAHALQILRPNADIIVWAHNDRGGARLKKEMIALGVLNASEISGDHARLVHGKRPDILPPSVAAACTDGAAHIHPTLQHWTQPGVFSWDRIDPGSSLLLQHLPTITGAGADFGCGVGILAQQVLASPTVTRLSLIDLDRRAIAAARLNITDARADFIWGDMTAPHLPLPSNLDFIVMNPPFHRQGQEDVDLGRIFITRASASLKKGGVCWLVANRHLPYEKILETCFTHIKTHAQESGFKIIAATR